MFVFGKITKFSPAPGHIATHIFGRSGGIFEVAADCFLNLLAAVQQPQHDETAPSSR